jgi:endonuclease YncB( thermonuclease family)
VTARALLPLIAALALALVPAESRSQEAPAGAALNKAVAARLAAQKKAAQKPEGSPSALPPTASVAGVARAETGDTLAIGVQRFRLWGIAAPRLAEFGGHTSQQGLFALLNGGATACSATGAFARDGLPLARCLTGGRDLSMEMVRAGFARDCPRQSLGTHAAAEREAVVDVAGGFELPPECLDD